MTRIIAGAFGGRRIVAPSGRGTRPTTDRVREALFSRLDHLGVLPGARVLDLYAGSGALGLEALSRGAAEAVLVESASSAARVTRRNVTELGAQAVVVGSPVAGYLRGGPDARDAADGLPGAARVDLVFCDPPYDLSEDDLAEALSLLVPWLAPDAVVVVERSARSPEPCWPPQMSRFAARTHGETALWLAEPDPAE